MQASDLREWIGLVLPEVVPDGQGGYSERLPAVLVADTPANVRIEGGSIPWTDQQNAERLTVSITIRFQEGITINYRIYWRSHILHQTSPPRNIGARDEWLEIRAERRELGMQA